jgi:hypothetical protein
MVVESLARQYGKDVEIAVFGNTVAEVYANNPHAKLIRMGFDDPDDQDASWRHAIYHYATVNENRKTGENESTTLDGVTVASCGTPRIHECNDVAVHMAQAMCEFVGEQAGLPIKLSTNRPHLYLTGAEKAQRFRPEPYYLLNAGWKATGETKWYSRWEEVVALLTEEWPQLQGFQIGELTDERAHKDMRHFHPPVLGAVNIVGQWNGDFRKLIVAANSAVFCMGPITALMHVCVALGVPYVCVASGYEPMSWAWMPGVRYVTRQFTLPCCRHGGCWKQTWATCVAMTKEKTPECMIIPPQEVVEAACELIDGGVASLSAEPRVPITIAMQYDDQMRAMGDAASARLREYARPHGYEVWVETRNLAEGRHPVWSKIQMVRKWLSENQTGWLCWMDADTVVMDGDRRLEDFLDDDADLVVGDDQPPNRFNAGVFFVRAGQASRDFFDAVWRRPSQDGTWREQTAMIEEAAARPEYRVKVVPRRTFNSFKDEFRAGDFLIHFAGQPRVQVAPGRTNPSIGNTNGKPKSLYELLPCKWRDPAAVLGDDGRPRRRDEPG